MFRSEVKSFRERKQLLRNPDLSCRQQRLLQELETTGDVNLDGTHRGGRAGPSPIACLPAAKPFGTALGPRNQIVE